MYLSKDSTVKFQQLSSLGCRLWIRVCNERPIPVELDSFITRRDRWVSHYARQVRQEEYAVRIPNARTDLKYMSAEPYYHFYKLKASKLHSRVLSKALNRDPEVVSNSEKGKYDISEGAGD